MKTKPLGKLASSVELVRRHDWRKALGATLDLIFPPICVSCDAFIEDANDGVLICRNCRAKFIDSRPPCPGCGAGIPEGANLSERCIRCRGIRFQFASVVRLGDYDSPLQSAILLAKQSTHLVIAKHLGKLLARVRGSELKALNADVIVPVPAYWTRRSKLGHNSPDTLADLLGQDLNLPVARRLLSRIRATKRQTELKPNERRANVRNAFKVQKHPDLPGATVLLVDDVLTTGSTTHETARMLRRAGAAIVHVAVLARAVGDD